MGAGPKFSPALVLMDETSSQAFRLDSHMHVESGPLRDIQTAVQTYIGDI